MRNILYSLVFIAGVLTLSACSSKSSTHSVAGEWLIMERTFTCSDEQLQKEINNSFRLYENALVDPTKADRFELTFGNEVEYAEDMFQGGKRLKSLKGTYAQNNDTYNLNVKITSTGIGSWIYDAKIADINNDFLLLKQDLTSTDIEKILFVYFDKTRNLSSSITGTLKTQAAKIKE